MQVHCKSCGSEIAADDIDLETMVAKCSSCSAVFRFADQVEEDAPARIDHPSVPVPKRIRLDQRGDTLEITRRWWSGIFVILVILAVMWNAVLVGSFSQGSTEGSTLVVGVVAGIGLLYFALVVLLNTTVLHEFMETGATLGATR